MKKKIIIILIFILLFIPINVKAEEQFNIYMFYLRTCPHCAAQKHYINDEIIKEFPQINLVQYELSDQSLNQFLDQVQQVNQVYSNTVPYLMIGDKVFIAHNSQTEVEIKEAVIKYINGGIHFEVPILVQNGTLTQSNYQTKVNEYNEAANKFREENKDTQIDIEERDENEFTIPILGKIDARIVSLPLIAIVIGLVDGFNPCAMWVLLFLISMLLSTKNRKRMGILGGAYLLTSALVYIAFMFAWINIALQMTQIMWLQRLIGCLALIGATINLKPVFFPKNDSGCEVVDDKKRKSIMYRVKEITNQKAIWLALVGVVVLTFTVTVVELACSAGLPLIFVQVLALNNVTTIETVIYTIIYVIFFLLDDLIIFTIAMISFKLAGITTKIAKYSHLIGGIIMLIIGLLLIFRPDLLNFT